MPAVRSRSVSTHSGPPSGVQVSSRPVSSPSTVRSSGSLARTRLSGRLVSGPSGVQPAGVCPSARSQPSRSASASGQPSRLDRVKFRVVRPLPGGSVDGPRRHGCGHRCGGRVEAGGGASAAGLGRGVLGREAAPTDQAGQTAARGALSLANALGQGSWLKREVTAPHRVGRPYGLEPRLLCVVVAEPAGRVDGPGRIRRVRRRGWRAAQCGPGR
jgi:hypothetical protein